MSGDMIEPEACALLAELDALLDKLASTDLSTLTGPQLLELTGGWERHTRRGAHARKGSR